MSGPPDTDFNLQHIQEQITRSRDKSERKHLRDLVAYMNRLRDENELLRAELRKWNIHGWWENKPATDTLTD